VQNETKKTLHGDIKYSTREDFVTLSVTVYMRCGICVKQVKTKKP